MLRESKGCKGCEFSSNKFKGREACDMVCGVCAYGVECVINSKATKRQKRNSKAPQQRQTQREWPTEQQNRTRQG